MALVQRYLTLADWHRLDKQVSAGYPRREVPFTLAWVLAGLAGEGQRRALKFIGGPATMVWRLAFKRWFERGEAIPFRYV